MLLPVTVLLPICISYDFPTISCNWLLGRLCFVIVKLDFGITKYFEIL